MPQLMPFNWLMSVFMMGFVFFMKVKMYNLMNNEVKDFHKSFCKEYLIWFLMMNLFSVFDVISYFNFSLNLSIFLIIMMVLFLVWMLFN